MSIRPLMGCFIFLMELSMDRFLPEPAKTAQRTLYISPLSITCPPESQDVRLLNPPWIPCYPLLRSKQESYVRGRTVDKNKHYPSEFLSLRHHAEIWFAIGTKLCDVMRLRSLVLEYQARGLVNLTTTTSPGKRYHHLLGWGQYTTRFLRRYSIMITKTTL